MSLPRQMKVVKNSKEMLRISSRIKESGKTIGFVPTMGYLHEGHISLIRRARRDNDLVVVSIFVNPIQFGPNEDYKKYPRNLRQDRKIARDKGCDIIFCPDAKQIYPKGYATRVKVSGLTSYMCGASRPGHFEGVTTVCAKLFNIVRPDIAYFGQKDYQQAVVITRMVKDLNMGLKIKTMPIVRERGGLAMSSRNEYLSPQQRRDAAALYESLKEAKKLIRSGCRESAGIKAAMRRMISKKPGIHIDYITIADPETLRSQNRLGAKSLIALAARIGRTRLIDNVLVDCE